MALDVRGLAPLLQVFDMPTSIRFYRDALGFEVVLQSHPGEHFHWALLKLNGLELMLNTAYDDGERPDTPDPARVAAHRDTIVYFGCPDVDVAYQHLRDKGLNVPEPSVAHGMRGFYLKDPDGYGIVFHWAVDKGSSTGAP